jgi:hypothetical protein
MLGISVVAIGLAIWLPLWIEKTKRPLLSIEWAEDANRRDPPAFRIAHVRVVNAPLTGRRGRWLARNSADGCEVRFTIASESDGRAVAFRGKWDARPEPIQPLVVGGQIVEILNPQLREQGFVLDVPPGPAGASLAVAIKHDGEKQAYGYGPSIYEQGNLRADDLRLDDDDYRVDVTVVAGGSEATATFVLTNAGTNATGLMLGKEPIRRSP